ncbi:MAG: hypothetical protein LC768_11705 [Acidobacteria bacterium]|nr:hypothetical protein [Acidobacteriota bacterium]MCA1638975.1 hypothetical protein [Acidobacteriota bacterium]
MMISKFDAQDFQAPEQVNGWRTISLGIGGIASVIILVIALIFPEYREQALRSWLLGFIFWGGIGIGCLGILILQYVTGGAWGVISRRILEAGSRTLPVIALLFVPLAIGATSLYEWSHLSDDPIIQHRQPYLNVGWWIFRAVLYFVLWGVMTVLLNRWSGRQDGAATYDEAAKLSADASKFSGPALAFFILVVSFAAIDWVMTLDPHWYSTMWGFLYVAGWGLSAFCFVVTILAFLVDKKPMNRVLGKRHFHDIGKLMLALVMVWAYFNFSQYLIIWSGNLPEETKWYITRMDGAWGAIGLLLLLFHFAFPFLVLLNRDIKRNAKWLAILAVFILLLRLLDMYYMIGPSPRIGTHGKELDFLSSFSWMDLVAPFAVGGIWLWAFFGELKKRPLVPINDPYLENAINHGKGH